MTAAIELTNRHKYAFLLIAITLAATALTLSAMGRLWVCSCDRVLLWAGDIWSSDNSQHLFDPYTFAHFVKGLGFFWLLVAVLKRAPVLWRLWVAVLIEAAWELLENSPPVIERFRAVTISLGYTGDTVLNSVGDIAVMALGFAIAMRLGFWRSAVLFVAVEIALALTVRDGLILTLIMLTFPIDAIRVWQMAGQP